MKHIKKCVLPALAVAMLLPLTARAAEPTMNIAELREQTPAYWQGEYINRKGRTVSFHAPILMPTADTFPVVRVARSDLSEEALAPYADNIEKDSATVKIKRLDLIEAQGEQLKKSGCLYSLGEEKSVYFHLWEENPKVDGSSIYAENQNASLADVANRLESLVKEIYGEEYDILIDQAGVNTTPSELVKRDGRYQAGEPLDLGEHTGMGSYDVHAILSVNGIPMLGGPKFRQGYSLRYKDNLLSNTCNGVELMRYVSDDVFMLYGRGYSIKEVVQEDVPLLSFDQIQQTVENLIDRDKVQHVYAMYLGWVYWLDPSVDYPNTQKEFAEGMKMPFLATPVWLVECCYASGTGRDYSEYPETELNGEVYNYRKHSWGHVMLMINAQTGEAYDPWDDSTQRKYAPKVMTW